MWRTFSGMPQPPYITSSSVHPPPPPATAPSLNQKEFACPTLPQNPPSETLQGKSTADVYLVQFGVIGDI